MFKLLLKDVFIFGFIFGISKVLSVFFLPFITEYLSPFEYGQLEKFVVISTYISLAYNIALDSGYQRFFYQDNIERNALINTTLSLIIIFSSIGTFLLTVITLLFFKSYFIDVIFVNIWVVVSNLNAIFLITIRYSGKRIKFSILTFINIAVGFISVYILLLYTDLGVTSYFIGMTIGAIFTFVINLFSIDNNISFKVDTKLVKELVIFSLPQLPARFVSLFINSLSKIYIGFIISISALGYYSAGYKVASLSQLLYFAFNMSWYPILYKSIEKKEFKNVKIVNEVVIIISVFYLSMLHVFSGYLSSVLLSDKFLESHNIVVLTSFIFIILLIKDSIDIGVKVTKKTIYTSYIYFIALIFNCFLLLVFRPVIIIDIVSIQVISFIFLLLLTFINSEKLHRIRFDICYNFIPIIIVYILVYFKLDNIYWILFVTLFIFWTFAKFMSLKLSNNNECI